jgi:hypothetical protein
VLAAHNGNANKQEKELNNRCERWLIQFLVSQLQCAKLDVLMPQRGFRN